MSTVAVAPPLSPEDQARAGVYALLGRLYSAPPDAALLAALAASERLPEDDDAGPWPAAFNRLADASSVMDPLAAEQEHTDLFIGVGKAEVVPTASHWLSGRMHDRSLVQLRAELGALGIARQAHASLTEDHLGPLLETMRLLVAGQSGHAAASVAAQRAFFARWIDSWADRCCAAIEDRAIANYYRRVAECTKVFLAIERDSFAIE
jgi:TorA maturation chaperone TorD